MFASAGTRYSTLDTMANIDNSKPNLSIQSNEQHQQHQGPQKQFVPANLDIDTHRGNVMFSGSHHYDQSLQQQQHRDSGSLPDAFGGRQKFGGAVLSDFYGPNSSGSNFSDSDKAPLTTPGSSEDYEQSKSGAAIYKPSTRSRKDESLPRLEAAEDHFLNRETSIAQRYQNIHPLSINFDDDDDVPQSRGRSGTLLHPMGMLPSEGRSSDEPQNGRAPQHRKPRADYYPTTDRIASGPQHHTASQQQQQHQMAVAHKHHNCPVHGTKTLAPWVSRS